jgi:hypothetical protein
MKKPGNVLIFIGWVSIVLSVIAIIGIIQGPYYKDPSIEAFLKHPESFSLADTIGFLFGSNILSLFGLVFGIYAVAKKNPKGKPLLITSIMIILIMCGVQLVLPSSESASAGQFSHLLVTTPQSEFEVTFPHPVKKKIITAGGIGTTAYETKEPLTKAHLRAEFINDIDTAYFESNLCNILMNHARLSGLNLPEITEFDDDLGKVGTYSGVIAVGDYTIKLYGKMVIGESSVVNCMICENIEIFPSEETIRFLSSIRRK